MKNRLPLISQSLSENAKGLLKQLDHDHAETLAPPPSSTHAKPISSVSSISSQAIALRTQVGIASRDFNSKKLETVLSEKVDQEKSAIWRLFSTAQVIKML